MILFTFSVVFCRINAALFKTFLNDQKWKDILLSACKTWVSVAPTS